MTSPAISLTAVVNTFPAPSQTFIQRKLRGLAQEGVAVTVAASDFGDRADFTDFGYLSLAPWRDLRHPLSEPNRRTLVSAARAAVPVPAGRTGGLTAKERIAFAPLIESDTQIVHFEFSGIAVTYRKALPHLGDAKLVVSCRGAAEQIVPLSDPTRGPQLREVFERADMIHCVSDDIRRTAEQLGAPGDRILVNRPAVPVARFAELSELRDQPDSHRQLRILSIGRLHWKKGFDDALRAIALLKNSAVDFEYRVAGEGPEREKLSFLIGDLDLGKDVELLGTCTQKQVREQLAWADVLLLPSLSEGISNAVLEAMSSGLPVVATSCGGMNEVIDDGADGYLVSVGDTQAMAERLQAISTDLDLRAQLGRAAMRRARTDFDISRQISVFLDGYSKILSS